MFVFLSHVLTPADPAWPGVPVIEVTRCTDIDEKNLFSSFISRLPNHFGTHMDAPRHFVKNGLSINDLSMDYFCHRKAALIDIPKDPEQGIYRKDLEPFEEILSHHSVVLLRTGIEKYRTLDPALYQKKGAFIAPDAGDYLTECFPNLKVIGMDFLSIGSASENVPEGESASDCHRHLLGYYSGKFCTGIEDMHLSDISKERTIKQFFNLPLRIEGLDSSQVVCIAELD